jgi:pilus assembly protein CpaB
VQLGRGILVKLNGGGRSVKVVVATRDLEPGAQIKEADITLSSMPVTGLPTGALMTAKDAIGRAVAIPVFKGQTIILGSLAPDGSGSGLQALVPPGYRAVTMEVNEFTGVGGLLFPGCRVDVVSTMQDEVTRRPVAKVIVQNAKVTAVGQKTAPKTSKNTELVSQPVKSVTMIVSSRDAMALDLAMSKGRPRLVLRGAADDKPTHVGRVTMAELFGDGSTNYTPTVENIATTQPTNDYHAAPAPTDPFESARSGHAIQVISGGTVTEVTFPENGSEQTPSSKTLDRKR